MTINIFLLVVFTCLEPLVVQRLQPYLCSPISNINCTKHNFPASTNPWVPLPVPVLPHLLEWRPVGLRCLDRLLQLLIRPGKTWTKSPRQWQITKNHKFKPRPRPGAPSSGLRSSSASWPGFPRRGNSSWQWHACQGCLFVGRRRAYFQQGWKYTIDFSQMTIREALKILFF